VFLPGFRVDAESDVPVYRQIVDAVREAIRSRRLESGTRLPPTREFARQLGVNRNTVVSAYDELIASGIAEGHTGRGTFIAAGAVLPVDDAVVDGPWFSSFSRAAEGPGVAGLLSAYSVALSNRGISFAGSYPAPELMPIEAFRSAMTDTMRDLGPDVLSYGPTAGYLPLRETIAAEMRSRGAPAASDDILITNGSQQAIELTFRAFLDPGDPVVLETPTYTGALSVLSSLGARLVPVPGDEEGMRPDLLEAALERYRPRLLYVQPTFHNPTTRVMSKARRREILAAANRHRCPILEDDWAADLRFDGEDLPTLHEMDGGHRVIYLSTFSKKLLPGIRVGWVAAPSAVLERLVTLKQIEDHGSSPLIHAALNGFLRAGGLVEHLRKIRPAYRSRRDLMIRAIESAWPREVRFARPAGGLFLWISLPEGLDSNDLFVEAREEGVLFSRGELFHSDGGGHNTLRLTYAAVAPERIEEGIRILGDLIRAKKEGPAGVATPRAGEAVPIL
jgi:GntR family transcriptional regulator/MocR family aminotransferase